MPTLKRFPASRGPPLFTQVPPPERETFTGADLGVSGGFIGGASTREGVMQMVEESLKQTS